MHAPAGDIMKNYRPLVAPQLEAGVCIMIYAGVGEFTASAAVLKSSHAAKMLTVLTALQMIGSATGWATING